MFSIGKFNRNNNETNVDLKYLYKDHTGRYLFTSCRSNMNFTSIDEAVNFIHFNSNLFNHLLERFDSLVVIPITNNGGNIKVVYEN